MRQTRSVAAANLFEFSFGLGESGAALRVLLYGFGFLVPNLVATEYYNSTKLVTTLWRVSTRVMQALASTNGCQIKSIWDGGQ